MSIGHPPKNVRQVVFFKEQITLTIINRREGGENTYIALGIAAKVILYISRAVSYFDET